MPDFYSAKIWFAAAGFWSGFGMIVNGLAGLSGCFASTSERLPSRGAVV